jgi:hypothetical protein
VLEEIFRVAAIKKLTILSHSQGSQIAIDALWYPQALDRVDRQLSVKANPQNGINLVTMGAPFTHLYQHYFPFRYPLLFTFDSATREPKPNADGWPHSGLATLVNNWLNLYRVDDYVGTFIDGKRDGMFPKNEEVGVGGHIGYWEQQEVIEKVSRLLPGL